MPPTRVCADCSATVNIRKSVCTRGHVFTPKKSGPLSLRKSKRVAMSVKRSLESEIEISARKNKNNVRKAKNRALEDDDQFLQRKKRDSARTAKKRASETQEEALCRQERDRACTAKKRASETQEEALCRQERNRVHIAKKRALESFEDYFQRKQSNRIAMTNKRSKTLSVECAISAFHAEVKVGPEFACACCHRMMYRKSVILCNRANYTKAITEILQEVFSPKLGYISSDGN